jgi:late control gene D protein (GPD)
MAAEFRLYFDNEAADDDRLGRFSEIRVDQAIGMAAEAELDLDLSVDDDGNWDEMDEDFVQPQTRVRIEIKVGDDGEFVPLIEGTIVANRFELSAEPEESKMTLVVQDDSVLLNQNETVQLFQDQRADQIATQLFSDAQLEPDVDQVPDAGNALERFIVQRGTPMQLLKELARRHGIFVYVRPGDAPGASVGAFKSPSWEPSDLPELLLLGEDRNLARFSAQLDAQKPVTATAYSVSATDKTQTTSTVTAPDIDPLGDEAIQDALSPAAALLARTREEQSDLDAAATAAMNLSTFALTASGEVDADGYSGVLTPYQVVSVAGAGDVLSGDYLISRVTHTINDDRYKQQFELKRNARSTGSSGGGLPDIF